ncbi:MAG: hypothetical protein E7062_10420 [Spirochaetaceae bacterium]|nr:hypothetical protein [Spirochaetaceae bacterium]
MKKLALLGVLLLCLTLVSCPILNTPHLPGMNVEIDKLEVYTGETIELEGHINMRKLYSNTYSIIYIENYPENYKIEEGDLYPNLTDEKYLCIIPEEFGKNEGKIKVRMSFYEPGEYTLKTNATSSYVQEISYGWFNEEFFTYKILVK